MSQVFGKLFEIKINLTCMKNYMTIVEIVRDNGGQIE